MPNELHDLEPEEVSLVGKAANKRKFLLRKGADMALDEVKALNLIEKIDAAGEGAALEALAGSVPEEITKAGKPTGMDDETWGKYCSAMKIMGPQLAKRFKMAPPDNDEDEDDMPTPKTKTKKADETVELPEEVTVALAKAAEDRERLTKAETELATLKDQRERETFIRKAAEFSSVPGANADDLGAILHKANKALEPKQYEKLVSVLKAAHETIKTGKVFTEIGAEGEGAPVGAYEEITKLAADLKKADPTLTDAQARARVIKSRKDLVLKAHAEQDEIIRKGR